MSTQGPRTFDPASLEILWSRLISITEECWVTLWRTAFSMIIGEAQDFGCELLDATGQSLAHSPRSMPVFNLTLPLAVRTLLQRFPPDTLEEGDVLATNDPWICAGHLYDVALVSPVFLRGNLVGLVGSIAHWSDIGGTRDPLAAREVYEEGFQIPPLKLYRRGEPSSDVLDLIHRNVRAGETVLGDLQAQLSANRVGAARLLEFMDEYFLENLSDLARIIQGRAEGAMRAAIAAVPDGKYRASVECDSPDGGSITLPVQITVAKDELTVDWTGAPPQVDRGGVNCTLSYTSAHTVYALKCILTPEIPSNAGCFRPLHVTAPAGSILNCRYPAAVNLRTMVGWYCAPAIFQALAPALAARVQAFTGMPMGVGAYGSDVDDRLFNDHLFQGGGQGASAVGDGKSALLFPTSAASTSVEMFEARTALVVEAKELIPDSGGAGRHRGGLGQRVRIRKLFDDGRRALISLHPQGLRVDIPGLFDGRPGRRASITFEKDGHQVDAPDLGGLAELRDRDARLTIELAGGSGYGNPKERAETAVQKDYEEGYVSIEGLAAYGCRLGRSNEVTR